MTTRPTRAQEKNRFAGPAIGFCAAVSCLGFGVAASQQLQSATAIASPAQALFFESSVRPVLLANCSNCHGANNPAAGLRLDSVENILKGGKSGPAIVPGDPDKSLLIQAVRQTGALKMPLGGILKPEQVANLAAWVKMGAPWPVDSSGKTTQDFWSLQPVRKPAIPKVHDAAWVKEPIDAYVLANLEAKHLHPAAEADRRTLIRRLTYDLIGLPPTPDEVEAFLADKSKDAYEKVVDRLLASPHYGERWARHWLDVARYSDTKGYVFNEDRNYPNAYTYRDWVISAFNSDLPYDQFVIQQLAADRLPQVQNGDDLRPLAALGFLTVGRRFLNSEPDIIDDRIDVTMRGFEGFTVECARCHDHKFDPIPTQDYYSLYAVFESSTEKEMPISGKSIDKPWEQYQDRMKALQASIAKVSLEQTELLRKKLVDANASRGITQEQKDVLQSIADGQPALDANLAKLMPAFEPSAADQLRKSLDEIKALNDHTPTKPELAMAMVDIKNPRDGVVFLHGNPSAPGEPAPRRHLAALSKPGVQREHWTKDSGRLELAEDIASKDNPLTARVFVNRLWQDHFGMGIVNTASDFGKQGERPSDQHLLDFLAADFMEHDWDIKRIQKMIVMSATYRQSCDISPMDFATDPENRLFGRQNRRRLDLEEMRDSFLQAAGKLDLSQVGGKSVDLWSEPFTNRRAVYGFVERQNLPGIFRTFDFATPDSTSAKRFQTTVPQQALFFMNSSFSVEAAQALANRPEIKATNDAAKKIRLLYLDLFQRLPSPNEMKLGLDYLKPGAYGTVERPDDVWSYGYGGFDAGRQRVTSFTPISYYADGAYRVGKAFPDPALGYITLNPKGGHPGHDQNHAVIRRWTAPSEMTVRVSGELAHAQDKGDGVRALVVSSSLGLLGEWKAFHSSATTEIASIHVKKGDTLDFVVDPMTNDAYDSFSWAPVIAATDGKGVWNTADLGPPAGPDLNRLTLYAQALLMTNEFMFID